jgi:hypothetical protein
VDGLAYPCTCLRLIAAYRWAGPTCKVPPGLVVVVVGGTGRGKGSFPGRCYLMEGLSSLIHIYGILHIANGF